MSEMFQIIQKTIDENSVVLYMKGNKDFPQCGFSATVVHILKNLSVEFLDIDILQDQELRQAIKDFSDWPTIPQLYIKGEFVGGCDIIKESFKSGELQEILKNYNLI
ncbi:MAG: Grx4 family monothiol glutaredoxin [Rickettsiales bacterium]|jgi:monothiol glutaredoxin|nr:Grx4 family monothiol glutaredoxin [Rickettsiales bacterium]